MQKYIFRIFIGISFIFVLAAGAATQYVTSTPQNLKAPRVYQLVMFKVGPAWIKDKSIMMQPGIQEHAAYMSKLIKDGILILGGALFEDSGLSVANGAVIILAVDTPEAARKILEADPANSSGLIQITEIRPLMITGSSWHPLPIQ
jgi:uncharacterized protein YciI